MTKQVREEGGQCAADDKVAVFSRVVYLVVDAVKQGDEGGEAVGIPQQI